MFKIESYITPLLMGYLDKYVKLRPEDFQLSLWGGDAVLYNLDLRLDIIEKAVQLPIVFQSGHIHELRLHVPWTKLGSDPVVVTINTIECILKLRDTAYKDRGSRASSETPRKSNQKQKIRKQEVDLPPGYLQSLMNKIINNVSIIVNNLILKFVEDDIVLSLNIKSAECYSVDKDWSRAFIELLAPDFVLRRTINFCDVTVCLDKRDASGKIENYQDPVVYRCSIASRLYTKYENMHSKYPLETKLNVYCEKLDLSLTDTQLPMLIRLIELCLALYYGTLEFKVEPSEEEPGQQSVDRETKTDSSVGEPPPEELGQEQQSWTSWAWSYVPQILPDDEDEEGEPQSGPPKKPPPLIFTLGMYAYKMTVKFKLTEYLREKAHYGPKKIVFKPFLYLESDGISMEMLMQGITFFDVQFGVTSVAVYSQGPCICGAESEENSRNNVLLSGGDNLLTKTTTNYICQSLFDQQSPENLGIPISKILDFDEHKQVYTEQYGVQKFGFFWMDMLYSMVKPDEKSSHTSSSSSVSSQDDLTVFIQESSLSRFVIGQSHLNVSSTTVHRIQKVLDAAYKYEYEPYSKPQKERVDESRPHPTEEQMKSMEEYIPTRTYHMTLLQPIISILSAEHAHCDIAKKTYRSSQQKAHNKPQQATVLHPLFGLQISSQRFDLQWTSPMYPRKLVQLVSKIAGPSSNLLHHCHTHTQMKLFGFQVGVTKVDSVGTRSAIVTVIPPTSGAMYTRKLLMTMYWTNSYLPKLERVYELPQISLSVSKPALHIVLAIVSSWKQSNPKPADILADSLLEDVFPTHETDERPKHAVLEITLSGFEMKTCRNDMVTACSATLSSIYTLLYRYDGHKTSVTPIFSCPCDTESTHSTDWLINADSSRVEEIKNDCLMVTYQLPRNYDQVQAPAMVLMNVEGIAVCFSPVLQTWFNYKPVTKLVQSREPKIELDIELAKMASPLQTNLSQVSVPSSGSKRQTLSLTRSPTTGQQSTVPAGNQEPKPPDNREQSGIGKKLAHIFPLIRVLQVQVEMKKACIFLPKQHIEMEEPSTDIVGNFQKIARSRSLCDMLVVCLPRVVIQSAAIKPLTSIPEIPITSVEGSLVGDKIPWNVSLQNCSVYTVHTTPSFKALQLVKPATVSCTVGVSYKYTPPTSDTISALGLCLHTDMHSVTASTSLEQVKLVMDITYSSIITCKQAVSFLSEISSCLATEDKSKKPVTEPLHYQNQGQNLPPQTASVASVSQSDIPYTQTSGDITSLDTPSKELEILETTGEGVKLSLWLQWTLPKCEMRLYLKGRQGETKIRALLEDMTMSVDVQDVYSKLKLNVGAAGISHFQRQGGSGQWQKGAEQGILMSCRDNLSHDTHIISSRLWSGDHGSATLTMFQGSQPQREIPHGFISLTFTRALRRNVKKRLQKLNIDVSNIDMRGRGDIENLFYFNKYVSEVCLNVAPCDFILCLEPVSVVLCNLISHLELPRTQKSGNRSSTVDERVSVPAVNTCNLPLLYADVSNVRIFIPGEATDQKQKGENSSKGEKCTTTIENDKFLFQVQSVSITPHADNPLPRYAVDKDLYQRALHLGITSESGAALSDTQFQVDIKGLSLTSGCWSDFLKHSDGKTASSVVTPSTQIPAVDWNSLTIREEHEEIQLFPLLSPCDLKLILAPALVNYTPVLGHNDLRASLVCGYGLEFNVVSDIDLHVSTNQIHLMHSKLTSSLKTLKLCTEQNDDNQDENSSVQDSGIGSEGSAATVQRSAVKQDVKGQGGKSSKKTLTPVDLLLTAGRISCTLYTHKKIETETKHEEKEEKLHVNKKKKRTKQDLEWRVDRSSEDDADGPVQYEGTQFEDPYLMHMYQLNSSAETKIIPAGSTCIEPFLFLYITQPHTVLSCQLDHQKFETSCYDILVKGAAENTLIPVSDVKLLPDCSDFTEYWLETRPGQPHQSTGIPASLYTLTVVDFLSKPGKITLKLERPVRMNVSFPKIRQVEEYYRKLLPWQQKKSDRNKPSSNSSSSDMKRPFALFNSIDSIAVQSEQVVVAMETKPCDEKPEIITSFSNFKGQAEFHHSSSGEIDSLILCSYMRDFLVKTMFNSRQLSMIGPCSVKIDGTYTSITQDDVHYLSQYAVTIATGLVTLHFGQEHALCLKMFADHCQQFYKDMMSGTETEEAHGFKADTPATSRKPLPADFVAHSSKDDLRSGEFQYVMDTAGVDVVPRPGEIVFCNRDREGNSSMTWSYSEPRVISALSSTPVPFNTAGLEKVECVLQYWETLVQQFIDFEDIDLQENEVTEVVLPDIRANSARDLVAAQIWRVMIRNTNEEIVLPPASLAAAMKVDSCFIPSLIPVIQVGLTMEAAQLHLHNHVYCLGTETPTKLQPFFMSPSYQPTGEFAVISLDNVLVAGSQWQKQQARNQLQFSTLLNVDLLEFKNLTMEKVISQFELSGNCNLQNIPKSAVLDVDITCEPVTVRVGQGVIHNLGCSLMAWNQILHDEPSDLEEIIFCHYVICNDTQLPVRFGQVGTDENLVLQSREMHQYGWRSHKMKQELHVCLDGPVWKWCDAVDLNKPGTFVRSVSSVDQQYTLILTIKRISNLQNQIIMSGLVTVSNCLELHMEVKVVTMETEHHAVAGSKNTIPSYVLEPQKIQGIKFRPWGMNGPWSKEVYVADSSMKENNLVKITSSSRVFHIWCRVIVHTVQNYQQIFVVLCPLYTVRSHLPHPLYINIDTSKLNLHEQIEAPGRGRDVQLQCPGGDVHQSLTFQFSANSGKSSTSVTLSTGLIDQLQRSTSKNFDPSMLSNYWRNDSWFEWPYTQNVKLEENSPKPDLYNITVPEREAGNQPTIDLNVNLSELWPGFQTLLVDVTPAFMVNNLCDIDLVFMGNEDVTYDIQRGQTICPPKLENSFHVGVKFGDRVHMSDPVPVSEEEVDEQRYRNDLGQTLFIDSYVYMPIYADVQGQPKVYFLTINSTIKNRIRVISIREKFVVTNLTKHLLQACVFAVPTWSKKVNIPVDSSFEISSHLGCPRDKSDLQPLTFIPLQFVHSSQQKNDFDQDTHLVSYLVLKNAGGTGIQNKESTKSCEKMKEISDHDEPLANKPLTPSRKNFDWTFPVRLVASENGCRMTTSLTVDSNNSVKQEALCITCQEKSGVTYIIIQIDSAPSCLIKNHCNIPLYYGQTLMDVATMGATLDTTIQEETELVNCLPSIPVNGAMYYTPPFLNKAFPQISDKHSIPKIHISGNLPTDGADKEISKVKWSNSIDLLVAADNFVSIPNVADVKVHVQQVAMVTHVTISPITKADVSAKEIRSRLKGKERTVVVESGLGEPVDVKIAEELKQALEIGAPRINEKEKEKSLKSMKTSIGLLVHQISLVVQNESSTYTKGEIVRLTVEDLFIASYPASDLVEQTGHHRNCLVCSIGDMQLDNQIQAQGNFDFPVVFVRQNIENDKYHSDHFQLSQMNILEKHAVLKSSSIIHVQIVFGSVNNRPSVIESVECAIKPLSFYIDDTFIFRCIKEAEGFLQVPLSIPEPLPVEVLKLPSGVKSLSRMLSNPVTIGHFSIQPVSVMFSIHASLKLFIASDHTPLSFGKFEKTYLCTTGYQLVRVLVMHYASGALFRAGAVVGSLEILGNPTGLVRSIGTGVADFFRMPYRGLTRGPGAFVVGVSQGTSSMVKNITTGMLKSVTDFASSVSRNMDRLSLDGSHMRRQEESRRHRPDGVGEGLKQGLTGLGLSLLGAVAGLADQPIQSLIVTDERGQSRSSTASGLVTGVGKGLVGIFTKPIGGAAEFVSQTGQGILHGTGLSKLPSQRMKPQVIDISLEPCGQVKYALKLLQTLPSNDILCCMEAVHIDLTEQDVPVTLILTPEILFVVNHEEDSQQQSFSILELECGVTQGDQPGEQPVLSIIWKDSQAFPEIQHEPSKTERVTAFVDAASKYIAAAPGLEEENGDKNWNIGHSQNEAVIQTTTCVNISKIDEKQQSGSLNQVEQLSDTVSDSSVEGMTATLPQYDFKMTATNLAAFLAIFNITKHRLAGIGFTI